MNDMLLLKFVAIILITNSHMDKLYPLSWLGFGGQLGNCLFFTLSGLGLTLSRLSKGTAEPFRSWMTRRLCRIYPSLWLVVLLFFVILGGAWKTWAPLQYAYHLIYPTDFWFISALLVFYFLIYPILKMGKFEKIPAFIVLLLLPYFYFYCTTVDLSYFSIEGAGLFKWIFYFQIVLFGMWLAPVYTAWKKDNICPGKKDLAYGCILFLVYLAFKVLLSKGLCLSFQFLIQWIMFPLTYYMFKLAQHPVLYLKSPLATSFVSTVGNCTLEIYLLQHILYTAPWVASLKFPFNILLFIIILLPLSYVLYLCSDYLRDLVSRKKVSASQ